MRYTTGLFLVITVIRADEAHHRDVNHELVDELAGKFITGGVIAPYPEHAQELRVTD